MQAVIRRSIRTTFVGAGTAAVLAVVAACGGGSAGTSIPGPGGPGTVAETAPRPVFALDPAIYEDPFAGALAATESMPELAVALAAGLAEASDRSGDATSPAAALSAEFTHLLTSHVYAVGAAATSSNETTPTSAPTKAALATVADNGRSIVRMLEKLANEIDGDTGSGSGRGTSRPLADDPAQPTAQEPTAEEPPAEEPAAKQGKAKKAAEEDNADEDGDDEGKKGKKNKRPKAPPFDLEGYDLMAEWSAHSEALFDYAVAAKESNDVGRRSARADLDEFRAEVGQYFRAVTENRVSSGEAAGEVSRYLTATTEALDALAVRDGEGYIALRTAATTIPPLASRLAAGYADATDRDGSVNDEAAQLRNELTNLLTGHSYLSSLSYLVAFNNAEAEPFTNGAYRRVQISLDDTAKTLATRVGEVSDPRSEFEFLSAWRVHLRDLQGYAAGVLGGDLAERTRAMAALKTYLAEAGKFFRKVTGGAITPADVESALQAEIEAQAGVIDALAATSAPADS